MKMMKLGSILKSRGNLCAQLLDTNATTSTKDFCSFRNLMTNAGISPSNKNFRASDRIFAAYYVYKGKAALSAEPTPPSFIKSSSGDLRVKRQGSIMLSISPSIAERKYDWERKQLFALSPTEVGSFINLGPNGSCEFFHDPGMKKSNAGQVRKSLSVKAHADGSGYFISLTVTNNLTKTNERLTVPVTSAEFAVMRTSFSFVLPYIMGWDRYPSQRTKLEGSSTSASKRPLDSEWDR